MANTGYFVGGVILGAIAGAIGGAIVTKKRLEKEHAAEIEQMSKEFAKLDPYGPGNYGKIMDVQIQNSPKEPVKDIIGIVQDSSQLPSEAEVKMAQAVREYKSEEKTKVDYTAMYDGKSAEEKQGQATVFDLLNNVPEEEEEEDEDDTTIDIHSRADLHSTPYVITADEAADIPDNYDSQVFYYYAQNGALVDDFDEEVDESDISECLGRTIAESGFDKNMDRHLYVKNDRLNVIYHIEKHFSEWEGKK